MSNYIMDLRKIVGHRTLLQVGASVIVEDKEGRILLQKRTDNHCWAYAGGSVELDEKVEDAAKRELFEETGLFAKKLELFNIYSGKDTHYIYPNGDEVSTIDIVFICKEYSGELVMQEEEVEDLVFFDIDTMPENISPPVVPAINDWKKLKKKKDTVSDSASASDLLNNIDQIHTTEMGVERIKRFLSLDCDDVILWCKNKIQQASAKIERKGKNWYITVDGCVITVNAYSYTIITAHKIKK